MSGTSISPIGGGNTVFPSQLTLPRDTPSTGNVSGSNHAQGTGGANGNNPTQATGKIFEALGQLMQIIADLLKMVMQQLEQQQQQQQGNNATPTANNLALGLGNGGGNNGLFGGGVGDFSAPGSNPASPFDTSNDVPPPSDASSTPTF